VQAFPAVLFAGALGFRIREFFDVGGDERQRLDTAPQVKF
jgi:LemA protein